MMRRPSELPEPEWEGELKKAGYGLLAVLLTTVSWLAYELTCCYCQGKWFWR